MKFQDFHIKHHLAVATSSLQNINWLPAITKYELFIWRKKVVYFPSKYTSSIKPFFYFLEGQMDKDTRFGIITM